MNQAKHTPGPWYVGMKPGPMVYGPQGKQVVGINVMLDQPEVIANARLIAAAPELLDMLQALLHTSKAARAQGYGSEFILRKMEDKAAQVIAKARGEV